MWPQSEYCMEIKTWWASRRRPMGKITILPVMVNDMGNIQEVEVVSNNLLKFGDADKLTASVMQRLISAISSTAGFLL